MNPITWIGFDTGRATGFAVIEERPSGEPARRCGTWSLPEESAERISEFGRLARLLIDDAASHGNRVVLCYEHPKHHSGIRDAQWFGAYWGELLKIAKERDLSLLPANVSSWGAWAGLRGNRQARKEQSTRVATGRGWDPCDDNAADAALICEWARVKAVRTRETPVSPPVRAK